MAITIKNEREIGLMREASQAVALVHARIEAAIAPGVTTKDLDDIARDTLQEVGAVSLFLGHLGFKGRICASVNEEIVHGIPAARRVLKSGDIVSIDCGVVLDGYYGDAAITVAVGDEISPERQKLLKVTEESLYKAIEKARVGNTVGDIGQAVQEHVEANGFSVVREFVGHGIGTKLHEEPQVPNFRARGGDTRLREGMVLAIEPMVNSGRPEARVLEDKWTAVTADGQLSAQFEHTLVVTDDGAEILTQL